MELILELCSRVCGQVLIEHMQDTITTYSNFQKPTNLMCVFCCMYAKQQAHCCIHSTSMNGSGSYKIEFNQWEITN